MAARLSISSSVIANSTACRHLSMMPLLVRSDTNEESMNESLVPCRPVSWNRSSSHLRLVAKIAMGYRGYGMAVSEVISEGNIGLMQAVKRFEPDKGFRLATYARWWIKAAIQEYILRSWSLVKMGTSANQKKLFFNLRKAKSKISALEEGDLQPDQVKLIARRLGVTEQDVVEMNRRLGGDLSPNAQIRGGALWGRKEGERRSFEARRLAEEPITLDELAAEFGISRERVRQIEVTAF